MPMRKIKTYADLVNVLELQIANLPTYQAEVGATAQDIQDVIDLHANLILIADHCEVVDANKKTEFKVKQLMFDGEIGEGVPPLPVYVKLTWATTPVAGARDLTMNRNKRFMLGPGYKFEIGVALGIEVESPDGLVPSTVVPTIEVHGAQTGAMFGILVGNRGDSNMWQVQILRKGASVWENLDKFSGKTADVTVPLTNPGESEQIQVRIQLLKNNLPYGQLSLAATVTINP